MYTDGFLAFLNHLLQGRLILGSCINSCTLFGVYAGMWPFLSMIAPIHCRNAANGLIWSHGKVVTEIAQHEVCNLYDMWSNTSIFPSLEVTCAFFNLGFALVPLTGLLELLIYHLGMTCRILLSHAI